MITAEIRQAMIEAKEAACDPKPTLLEMIDAVQAEAADTEARQLSLLLTGDRAAPYAPALRRMAVLDACARFLQACVERPDDVAKRLRTKSREDAA